MVKIIDNSSTANIKVYTGQAAGIRKNGSALNPISSNGQKEDHVQLSSQAREIRDAMNTLHESPDIREEKVAVLRLQIQSGTYAVNPDTIADKMISESFLNELLCS